MKNISIITCCFCNKEINVTESHSARPIVTLNGDRCCVECNANIVCPTRISVWKEQDALRKKMLTCSNEIIKLNEALINISKGLQD